MEAAESGAVAFEEENPDRGIVDTDEKGYPCDEGNLEEFNVSQCPWLADEVTAYRVSATKFVGKEEERCLEEFRKFQDP